MSDGDDPIGDYEPASFEDDYLSHLDADEDQLQDALTDLDQQVAEYDTELTLEIAEESYTDAYWDTDVDRDRDHDFFVAYLDEDVETLQRQMPDSVFDHLDPDGEVHDIYSDDVVLRLITDHEHDVIEVMETDFEAIEIGRPPEEAVYQQWADQQA